MAITLTAGFNFANNELVTPAKLNAAQTALVLSMATARLLGRTTAGAGAAEEISVGSNLSLTGGALNLATNINSVNIGPTTPGTGAFTTVTANTDLVVNGSSAEVGGSVLISKVAGTSKNFLGSSTTNDGVITGSVSGDGVWRTANGNKLLLSVDGGSTAHMILLTTGLRLSSLAGVGTRNVVVDASGNLSAP